MFNEKIDVHIWKCKVIGGLHRLEFRIPKLYRFWAFRSLCVDLHSVRLKWRILNRHAGAHSFKSVITSTTHFANQFNCNWDKKRTGKGRAIGRGCWFKQGGMLPKVGRFQFSEQSHRSYALNVWAFLGCTLTAVWRKQKNAKNPGIWSSRCYDSPSCFLPNFTAIYNTGQFR